jgi:hypothetical protein
VIQARLFSRDLRIDYLDEVLQDGNNLAARFRRKLKKRIFLEVPENTPFPFPQFRAAGCELHQCHPVIVVRGSAGNYAAFFKGIQHSSDGWLRDSGLPGDLTHRKGATLGDGIQNSYLGLREGLAFTQDSHAAAAPAQYPVNVIAGADPVIKQFGRDIVAAHNVRSSEN